MAETDDKLKSTVESFKSEEQKFEVALKIADGDIATARKLVSGEIKDIAVIKGNFIEKSLQMYGLYIFYIDLKNKLVDRIFATIAFNPSYASVSPFLDWQDFESRLIEFEWSGNNMAGQSSELKQNISSYLNYEYLDKFTEAIKNNNEQRLKELMFDIISKSLQINTFQNEVSLELINKYILQIAGSKLDKDDKKVSADLLQDTSASDDEREKLIKDGEKILDGSVEISPIHGINLTKLQPGQQILVKLDDSTPEQQHYINIYNARNGKKILPIVATVRGVMYDESFGYFVIAEIQEGVVVRCIEPSPVNVKTPDIEEKEKKNKLLRNIILILAGIILILAGLYVYYFL